VTLAGTLLLFGACATSATDPTTTSSIPLVETTASTTLPPSGPAEFADLGLKTVVPSGWFLRQDALAHGSAAMIYDAGDTAALVVLGRVDELDEPITETDPTDMALAVSRQLAGFFFDPGTETVSAVTVSIPDAEAGAAQIRLDQDDGIHTVTRTTVVIDAAGARYATLLYQGGFPPERVSQGLEVLDKLGILLLP
jgi:hypothetical protein